MFEPVQDADRTVPRRALWQDQPLPQYELPPPTQPDVSDSARTVERPRVVVARAQSAARVVVAHATQPAAWAADTLQALAEDTARTVERPRVVATHTRPRARAAATQEVLVDDILEAIPLVSRKPAPVRATQVRATQVRAAPVRTAQVVAGPVLAAPMPQRRRRADATQEIQVDDVLEVIDVEPPADEPGNTPSVAPVAIEVAFRPSEAPPEDFSFEEPAGLGGQRHLGWIVGSVLVGAVVIFAAATVAASRPTLEGARITAAARAVPRAAKASERTAASAPGVSIAELPLVVPTTGTVRLAPSASVHRLFVDGAVRAGGVAEVRCGRHSVQVGSLGTPRTVMVSCGQDIVVAR